MSPFSNPVHYPSKYCDLKSNMDRNNITDFQFQTMYLHYRAGLYMTINVRISGRTFKAIGYMTTLISYLIQLHRVDFILPVIALTFRVLSSLQVFADA